MASKVEPITARDAYAITASDTTVYKNEFSALYVGTTGNVTLITTAGNSVLFSNVPGGFIIPIKGKQVMSTGTTASDIVGLTY